MKRKIVRIDPEKCNGCGLCVEACHEGALQLIDGKARLVSESYCDGLGDCLPECPTGAITIEEMEAAPYDEAAVQEHMRRRNRERQREDDESACASSYAGPKLECGCPGTAAREIRPATQLQETRASPRHGAPLTGPAASAAASQLRQWPCQLKLVPASASYLDRAHLLIAADCTAYAYASLHEDFMRGKITLIGCPKLDQCDYSEKLAEILEQHEIRSITILRMEVPCCGGLVEMVKSALRRSGQMIPWRVVTISRDGRILEEA
jgi:ferredoxin